MEWFLMLLSLLAKFLYVVCYPFFFFRKKCDQQVPPPKDELLFKSAKKLAYLIRYKKITSLEVIKTYIKRIEEVNGYINAVVENRFKEAVNEAKEIDAFLATTSLSTEELEKEKPLLGVPITIKESCSLAGMSLSVGAALRNGIKAEHNGETVEKLRNSGAVPLLVSNTPEMCICWETRNFITGVTNNPYDLNRTSGASSGGEGALLGCGASVIGIGSDVAGSIRLPAMFCGVFGHKPTARVVSIKGHFPSPDDVNLADYLVIGPMTRYAEDLSLMMKIMSDDSQIPLLQLDTPVDLSEINVYYMEEAGSSMALRSVDAKIKEAIKQSAKYLKEKCGSNVVENYKFPDMVDALNYDLTMLAHLNGLPNQLKSGGQNPVVEITKSLFGGSKFTFEYLTTLNVLMSAKKFLDKNNFNLNAKMRQIFLEKLGQNGVFIYPTFPHGAFKHKEMTFILSSLGYLSVFNTLGLPATNIPCGRDCDGLPIGLQVVAGPHQDRLCLAVAEKLEQYFGGWKFP